VEKHVFHYTSGMATIDFSNIRVLCDEPADRALFQRIKRLSPTLARIPDSSVTVYPATLDGQEYALIRPLMVDDRPDFIILQNNKPLLVVELTEHGYTGDNPLQRFTRLAAAAENRVPVIYFGPFARVRDDELDLVDDPATLSRRRVNTDLFRGMHRLSQIHSVPMAAAEWITGSNGKPLKEPLTADDTRLRVVFGQLITRADTLLRYSLLRENRHSKVPCSLQEELNEIENELSAAYSSPNVRGSQTKLLLDGAVSTEFVKSPQSILKVITRGDYFYKDKPERLLALLCIMNTEIRWLRIGTEVQRVNSGAELLAAVESQIPNLLSGMAFYYTGYKWRSDPHCGVLVNFDYLNAREQNERNASERNRPLVLFYPRIYLNRASPGVLKLQKDIQNATEEGSSFNKLFLERYGAAAASTRASMFINGTSGHIAQWKDTTKQARIFQRYCDLIFLQDAVIFGHHYG
jgi:hypothetical protein